jgi:hypothetical protein
MEVFNVGSESFKVNLLDLLNFLWFQEGRTFWRKGNK